MDNGWFSFDRKTTSKEIYISLNQNEKDIIDTFKDYLLISCSPIRADEGIREVLRFRKITGKELNDINKRELEYFLKELKQGDFADHTKNKIKDIVQRFLRWKYKDWSERFNEFRDIKINTFAQNKKEINSKTLLSMQDVKKLLDAEPYLFWQTFLITQYEGALRTLEVRSLEWDMITFEDDGFTILNIPSRKNTHGSTKINSVVVKIAGNFLERLKKQQDKYEIKSKFVFPSPQNPNKPISKSVNLWFSNLTKKVLGRSCNNYLLRHSKGTELQKKVRKGELSKDNAVEFMRHSEKMFDKVYSHMDKEDIRQLMKTQIYNTKELTEDKKNHLEKQLAILTKSQKQMHKIIETLVNKEVARTGNFKVLAEI